MSMPAIRANRLCAISFYFMPARPIPACPLFASMSPEPAMSDGLTVPFALAAGLSGAAVATHIVVTAGLAEIAAGSIAMGLGGFLAARSDAEHYASELAREQREIVERPDDERREVAEIFESYG